MPSSWKTYFSKYLYTKLGVYQIVSTNEKDWNATFMPKDPDFENMTVCEKVSKHTAMKRCRDHQKLLVSTLND